MKIIFCPGSTLVPITALATGSARLATRPPAECTVNVTSIGKARPATSLTAGTTVAAQTTATATSPGRSCVSATRAGKVRVSSINNQQVYIDLQISPKNCWQTWLNIAWIKLEHTGSWKFLSKATQCNFQVTDSWLLSLFSGSIK